MLALREAPCLPCTTLWTAPPGGVRCTGQRIQDPSLGEEQGWSNLAPQPEVRVGAEVGGIKP